MTRTAKLAITAAAGLAAITAAWLVARNRRNRP